MSEDILSYSRTRRRQLRRHRVAAPPGGMFQPQSAWAIQCYPNEDGTPGEIVTYSIAETEAGAWARFLSRAIGKQISYQNDGWKAVQVLEIYKVSK